MNHCAPQDPLLLLVAYADGELAAEARAALDVQLADNADLRDRLEGIRALQASLQAHLPAAPLVLDAARRHLVLQIAEPLRVPRATRWWTINRLAAACLAVAMLGLFLAIPNLAESRISAGSRMDAYGERGQAAPTRVAPIEAPTTTSPISTPAPGGNFFAIGAGGGGGVFSPDLDVPEPGSDGRGVPRGGFEAASRVEMEAGASSLLESTKEIAPEDETIVATRGREEAAADSINGGEGEAGRVDADKAKDAFKRFGVIDGLAKKSEGLQSQVAAKPDENKPADGRQFRTTESSAREAKSTPAQLAKPAAQAQAQKSASPPPPTIIINSLGNGESTQGIQSGYMSNGTSSDLKAASAGKQKPQQNKLSNNRPAESVLLADAVAHGFPLVQSYRSQGWQYLPVGDTINLVNGSDIRPLDPTATFGLAKADFKKAFGTVPMTATADTATLTFAFTADTATFDRARAQLHRGQAVEANVIQAEHFINAVPAGYPAASGPEAFNLYAEAGPSPFGAGSLAPRTALVCVGAVARPAGSDERRPLALTLAIDCSGSMAQPGGLERIRIGLNELFARLGADDSVAIVAFGDRARVVLPATPGAERARIAAAVAGLQTGGSTNAAEGLSLAYQLAAESAKPGRESRVLLATDGATLTGDSADGSSANAAAEPILARIAADRARGITLIVVGCGTQQQEPPQQTEATMDALAAKGDGQHYYVGSDDEARQLFSDKLVPAKLGVLARDAKVQVTWNPQRVTHARLIGFESRRLSAQDFRNDRVDAGEIAHDTQATALFEVILADGGSGPLGTAAVRYFDTRLNQVRELACPLPGSLVHSRVSPRLRLMACSADLADLLGRTWWANQRCATYAGLLAELARCEPSQFRDQLQAMATQAQQLTNEP